MSEFEEMKEKLNEISEIVAKYPDNLKENVFKMLTEPLGLAVITQAGNSKEETKKVTSKNSKKVNNKKRATTVKLVDDKNLISKSGELKQFIESRDLKTEVKFITAVVYFLRFELEIKNVDERYIMTCYKICGRKLGNISATIANCINRNQYLIRNDEGFYEVTGFGDNLVTIDSINKL